MECSGIPFGITAGGLTLNSLSLFTDHPLLRVSLITSRLLPRVIQEDQNEARMKMWMRMKVRLMRMGMGMRPPCLLAHHLIHKSLVALQGVGIYG